MKHVSAFAFSALVLPASAQLTVTDSLSVPEIAQLLEGLNVSIQNVSVHCAPWAMGHFTGDSELEISEGLLLTTGRADYIAYPVGMFASEGIGGLGDADLDAAVMVNGLTQDACRLEFDCIPLGDTLLFNFSFGSEEYPDFVGSAFNDVFAIWITGPGYPTPTNVAALPDGTPVAINNVNADVNASYFHDNLVPPGQFVAYDGFTTSLTAFAVVSPDDVYHFKVAIADVADNVFDSGVFLEAFSFRSTSLTTGIGEGEEEVRVTVGADAITLIAAERLIGSELQIMDAAGRTVRRERVQASSSVWPIASLPAGAYTIRVVGVAGIASSRFVKE
ncbi:MAG: T9SS type A sorting domain-containing protein [Flavobacteriales bacterium]|nr:T9SS type A sorting domain-containing protein [Flavobacteriales bacterium]